MRKHNLVEVPEPPTPATKKSALSIAFALDRAAQVPEPVMVARVWQRDTKDQPTTYVSLLNFSNEHKIIFRNMHSGKRRKGWSETFQSSRFHEMENQHVTGTAPKWEW